MTGVQTCALPISGEIFPMESVHKAVQHNLINPIFIGNENEIKKYAEKLKWNISKYKIIDEKDENKTAPIAAKLASEDKVKIIVKGHIHTDVLMKEVFKREHKLLGKKRCRRLEGWETKWSRNTNLYQWRQVCWRIQGWQKRRSRIIHL